MVFERRAVARYPVCLPVRYISPNIDFFSVTFDLNEKGAFVYSNILDTPDTFIELEFFYIAGKIFKTKGRVAWATTELNRWKALGRTGMGIEFLSPEPQTVTNIKWYIATYKERPRVIIIDDEPLFLKAITRKLERDGIRAIPLLDSMFSVRIIEEIDPICILIDYNMQELCFDTAIEKLRLSKRLEDIPIVLVSSESEETLKKVSSRYNINEYIKKEQLDKTLLSIIKEFVKLRENRPTLRDFCIEEILKRNR